MIRARVQQSHGDWTVDVIDTEPLPHSVCHIDARGTWGDAMKAAAASLWVLA